jgi:ribonuclease D
LRDLMAADLERAGRMSWAREEFLLLEDVRWSPDEPQNAFLRLKGARDLTRRQLAILRELVPWRDAIAAQLDRATFRVMGNEQLLEIARTQPSTREALAASKGMPRGLLESRGHEMLGAVSRGLAVAEADLPRFPKSARWDRDPDFDARVSALKTVRDAVAQRLDMDPGVLCSRERMEAVARKNPESVADVDAVAELRNWQREVLAEGFVKALRNHRGRPAASAPNDSPYRD